MWAFVLWAIALEFPDRDGVVVDFMRTWWYSQDLTSVPPPRCDKPYRCITMGMNDLPSLLVRWRHQLAVLCPLLNFVVRQRASTPSSSGRGGEFLLVHRPLRCSPCAPMVYPLASSRLQARQPALPPPILRDLNAWVHYTEWGQLRNFLPVTWGQRWRPIGWGWHCWVLCNICGIPGAGEEAGRGQPGM